MPMEARPGSSERSRAVVVGRPAGCASAGLALRRGPSSRNFLGCAHRSTGPLDLPAKKQADKSSQKQVGVSVVRSVNAVGIEA